jgi:hypothetical protein
VQLHGHGHEIAVPDLDGYRGQFRDHRCHKLCSLAARASRAVR